MIKTFCLFSALYAPSMGGVEKYTQHLAEALIAQGHTVVIVTENCFNLLAVEHLREHLTIIRLPAVKGLGGRYPLPRFGGRRKKLLQQAAGLKPDYVVVNTRFYPLGLTGLRFARDLGIAPVLIDHGSAHLSLGSPLIDPLVAQVEHAFTRMALRYQPACYGVSTASSRWLSHFGIKAQGILPNAIDADRFADGASSTDWRTRLHCQAEDFLVVFSGRFTPEKGVATVVEAARLLQTSPHIVFALAGDGPLRTELEQNAPSNVRFTGIVDEHDMAALLATANAFCLPTRSEGFSTSLLEAAAAGTAPLLPPVGGTEELMPTDEFGVLLSGTRSEDVASAIADLANDPERCAHMGAAIAQRVRGNYSWANTADAVWQACKTANAS